MAGCEQDTQADAADRPVAVRPAAMRHMALAIACFFASGFLALALEICWIRKASLVFGTATFALSTVLAVFFAGLATGSYFFGRWSGRIRRPLRMYAAAEIGVGTLALLSPLAFSTGDAIYGRFYPALLDNFVLLSLVRLLLVAAILLPPTILMGATLPLFCRQFVKNETRIARSVGFLYGVNTLGAAIGCATCGFLMIRYIGVDRSIYLCSGINILVGLLVWRLPLAAADSFADDTEPANRNEPAPAPAFQPSGPSETTTQRQAWLVPLLFFLAGFIALGNEVLWTRFLSLLMHNTVYTYTLTLTVVLIGIVLGSMITSRWIDRTRRRALVYGFVQVAIGLTVMVVMMLPADWWGRWRDPQNLSTQLWVVLAVLLIPGVLSGISFPLAIRMVVSDPAQAGRGVGRMAALNTMGGIGGALSVGFIVLPLFGMQVTLWMTTALSVCCGMVAWIYLERSVAAWIRATLVIASGLIWLAIPLFMGTSLPASHLENGGTLVEFREGLSSQVAVVRREATLRLEIDRLWQGENHKTHQIMAAHVPMFLHGSSTSPSRRDSKPPTHGPSNSVLVVGIGPGQTAQRFLMYPTVQELDCVDIERELIPLIKTYFDGDWLTDPRVRIIMEDGRNYVTHTDKQYDIISIEVGQAFRPGVASFYTTEFYQQAKSRLKPGGLVSQFAPLGFFSHQTEEFRTVIRTFLDVFPNSVLWYNDRECLLIGSATDEITLSADSLAMLTNNPQVREDLKYSPWGGPAYWLNQPKMFLAGFLSGPEGLARLAGDAPLYHDDRPYLEYAVNSHFSAAELPVVQLIQSCLEPVSSVLDAPLDRQTLAEIAENRNRNLRDIAAATIAIGIGNLIQSGDPQRAEAIAREGLELNPERIRLYASLGIALLHQQEVDEAVKSFQDGLLRDPDDFSCHLGLGRTYFTLRKLDRAISHLRRAAALRPDYAEPRFNLAQAYRRLKRPDEAVEAYRESLRLDPDHGLAHRELGMLLGSRGESEQAIEHLEQSVRLDPYSAQGHFLLANTLQAADRPEEAVEHYRQSVRLAPDAVPACNSLAWLLATHPNASVRIPAEAIQHAEHVAKLTDNRNASVLDTLAAAYASAGRFADAVQTAEAAIEIALSEKDTRLGDEIRFRLSLYKDEKTYRPPAPSKPPR